MEIIMEITVKNTTIVTLHTDDIELLKIIMDKLIERYLISERVTKPLTIRITPTAD
jgi:hypothetical protein